MGADDEVCRFSGDDRRPARRRSPEVEEGAVQPALPAGDRPAREHGARAPGAPRHRAHKDNRGAEALRATGACAKGRAGGQNRNKAQARSAREGEVEVGDQDAEAHVARRRCERQAGQDRGGARRAPFHPSGHEENCAELQEVLRPRREERVLGGRHRQDRRAPAAVEAQALGSDPGREEENGRRMSALRAGTRARRAS